MTNYRQDPVSASQMASDCHSSENGTEGKILGDIPTSVVIQQPHSRRKRGAGRPRASGQRGRYRRELRQPNRAIIRRSAVQTMQRGYDRAIAIKKPLKAFVTVRWAYSAHQGKSPADMVNKFFTAASGFFRRKALRMTYIATLENPPSDDDGFHVHMLLHIPTGLEEAFEGWLRAYVRGEERAVDIQTNADRGVLSYICKACDPFTAIGLGWEIETDTWKFNQGIMPEGLRRWRMSADLHTEALTKAGSRYVRFTDRTGTEIREARLMRGWSTKTLAKKAKLNRNSIIRLERFERVPESSRYSLDAVEKAFKRD